MRILLIVLVIVGCAPITDVQRPAATPQLPTSNFQLPTTSLTTPPSDYPTTRPLDHPTIRPTNQPPISSPQSLISESRLRTDLLTLQNFQTRHSASATHDAGAGIGAARAWLIAQFKRISPRLQVETDDFVFAFGGRPLAAQNIIATLPCKACRVSETQPVSESNHIIISAHYDSRTVDIEDVWGVAPGANDDGSGTVAVLELARVLSQQPLDATIMFILFAGEEEGLYGSAHLAPLMRKHGAHVIAMLNNDIIGNTLGADGARIADRVRILSGDPDDGPSRILARQARQIVERDVPGFGVELVAALDHAGRGGDHVPFHYAGFPAIRFIEAVENLQHQHNANDRVEFMDMAYLAQVVRANLAVALELAKSDR